MSEIHLNDLTKIYNDQIVEKKKDDTYLEPDMKKRQVNNEKARKDMQKMGTSMKNPHFEEKQSGSDIVKSLADAYKEMQEIEEVHKGKHGQTDKQYADSRSSGGKMVSGDSKMSGAEYTHGRRVKAANPGMQPDVGGKTKPKSQGKMDKGTRADLEYRKANLKKEGLDPVGKEDGDVNNDGKKDTTDKYLLKRRKAIGKAIAKSSQKKMSESISDWRQELSEIMTDDIESKPIKEKKIKNKVTINPKLGEAVEELGGELLEMIEVDEATYGSSNKPAPTDKRLTVTNADKAGNTPAYQRMKAGDKRYKAADHMGEDVKVSEASENMETPKGQQIQKKQLELDRRKLRLRMQAAQKKQATAADTVVEKHECAHNMKGKECPVHGKKDCSSMDEATEDSLKDRRMERGGVDGNNRYNKAPGKPNTFGKKPGQKYDGMSALEKVKASIRAKHGQGAIKEDAKMAKQSDEKLAALHKQVSASDQSLPSNQFMMKRVSKEMNRRKKAT
jgi:hypothetical protein